MSRYGNTGEQKITIPLALFQELSDAQSVLYAAHAKGFVTMKQWDGIKAELAKAIEDSEGKTE